MSVLVAGKSLAQSFTNPLTTAPAFLQDGFGPAGDLLPYGGQEYCYPTTAAMTLSYLGLNGFNQIAPATPTAASELNLVRVLSGLMATDALGGTLNTDLESGVRLYLAAEGIGTANYTLTLTGSPTLSTLASLDQPGTVVDLLGGYYNSSGSRTGGHGVMLLAQGTNAFGQSSTNTIAINNPLPGAWTPNADLATHDPQYLNTVATTGNLTGDGALELDKSQYPGFWSNSTLVIENALSLKVNTSQQSVNNPTLATWTLSGTQTINLNSGTLPVLAPIAGSGGISAGAFGFLQLQATDTSTGTNSIYSGTVESTITTGQPFGSGSLSFQQGALEMSPKAGTSGVSLAVASASGKTVTFVNGTQITLSPNGHSSLDLTLGGNTDGSTANLIRQGTGTMVIAPAGGNSGLGQGERLIVSGSGGNLPGLTNGIASPAVVAQDSDPWSSGDFVTYGGNGFAKASYTAASSTPIGSVASNAVYFADVSQMLAAGKTAQVYALKVGAVTVGGGSGSVLQVGTQAGGQAGIILDGGTISAPSLAFGTGEGVVYASVAGGTISSVIQGSGSNGLTTFGPGTLALKGASTYTGATNVNSGVLQVENTAGSATGTGSIMVHPGGALEISGAAALAGGTGTTTMDGGSALLLNGGTLAGTLVMNKNSYLFGSGKIMGTATVSGVIGISGTPSQLPAYSGVEDVTFTGPATFNGTTIYSWKLNALSSATNEAGIDWSLLNFTNGATNMGTSGNSFHLTLDLGASVPSPNSGNAFWNTSHQWLVADDPKGFHNIWWNDDFGTYLQGSFSVTADAGFDNLYVDYTPLNSHPAATITAPAAASITGTLGGTVNMTGAATDSVGVDHVLVTLNGGTPIFATLAANQATGTTYSLTLSPVGGLNTLQVQCFDAAGNGSPVVTRSFTYVINLAITVTISGPGKVTGQLAAYQVGKTYTLTAVPTAVPADIFSSWAGAGLPSAATTLPKLTFVFSSTLAASPTITATFVANPFTSAVTGGYNGLVTAIPLPSIPLNEQTGFVNLTVTNTGSFTGSLKLGGLSLPLTGQFNSAGIALFGASRSVVVVLPRPGLPSLELEVLVLNTATLKMSALIFEQVSGGLLPFASLGADRAAFSATSPVPASNTNKGSYTVVIPSQAQTNGLTAVDFPQGDGIGSITVTTAGVATLSVTLADGAAFTASAPLSAAFTCPLYASLYSGGGSFSGAITVDDNQASTDLDGSGFLWLKPYAGGQVYPFGWPEGVTTSLMGAKFAVVAGHCVVPGLTVVAPPAINAVITLSSGGLVSAIAKDVNISPLNVVTKFDSADLSYTLGVTASTGRFAGVFTATDGTKPAYSGVVFGKPGGSFNGGYGYFLTPTPKVIDGTGQSGLVALQPLAP